MLQGVDVWLNTPQQGKEASGTSGMKAAMNGAINLSTLDGWWVEGYSPQVGWRVGGGESDEDPQAYNDIEAEALYDLLDQDVPPLFYRHGSDGLPARVDRQDEASCSRSRRCSIPTVWCASMPRGVISLRTTVERLRTDGASRPRNITTWIQGVYSHWGEVRIVSVTSDAQDGTPVRSEIQVDVQMELGSLTPDDVAVRVYHGTLTPETNMADYDVSTLEAVGQDEHGYHYSGTIVVASSGRYGLTVQVTPHHVELGSGDLPGLALWSN
jgi:starch phosphorylase